LICAGVFFLFVIVKILEVSGLTELMELKKRTEKLVEVLSERRKEEKEKED
jgi:hypothetical protein